MESAFKICVCWSRLAGQLCWGTNEWSRSTNSSEFLPAPCTQWEGRCRHRMANDSLSPEQLQLRGPRLLGSYALLYTCSCAQWPLRTDLSIPVHRNWWKSHVNPRLSDFRLKPIPNIKLLQHQNNFGWSELYFLLFAKELYILPTFAAIHPHPPPKKHHTKTRREQQLVTSCKA